MPGPLPGGVYESEGGHVRHECTRQDLSPDLDCRALDLTADPTRYTLPARARSAQQMSDDMREAAVATVRNEGGKVYIAGVRKVSWDTGEMCEFASSLLSAMLCLGEPASYPLIMGTSGVAFRFTLTPSECEFGDYSIRNVAPDPHEPVRRAFRALGDDCILHNKGAKAEDAARIMASIDRGVPVLAYPVVGPSDCCVLTGYDDRGEVLLGWSTYQNIPVDHDIPHDETGYFRKPGWHDNLEGYVLIGAKKSRPPKREIYLDALRWAVQLMRTPNMGAKRTGLAGLGAWAKEMTEDRLFLAGDEEALGMRYISTAINITMLKDHGSAEPFLRQVAQELPEVAVAADLYREVHQLRASMDELIRDDFSPGAMAAIADLRTRRSFADRILQIRDKEEEAVAYLDNFLHLGSDLELQYKPRMPSRHLR